MSTNVTREDLVIMALDEASRLGATPDRKSITRYVGTHIATQPVEALLDSFASFAISRNVKFDPDAEVSYQAIKREIVWREASYEESQGEPTPREPKPGDCCQILDDGLVRHIDCEEYAEGTVTRHGKIIQGL